MERKLASIQRIVEIRDLENSDSLSVAKVLGWEVVTKRGQFNVNDLVCYFEVDSVLPQTPQFAFLADRNYRIKTIRLRGQLSQGLILPVKDFFLENDIPFLKEGDNVTDFIGVKKYEVPVAPEMAGQIEGAFPGWISKTDETRIQSAPRLIDEIWGLPYYVTQKDDGTSATYALDDTGKFIVCSRNLSLKPSGSIYWKMAEKYNLQTHLESLGMLSVFQGEIVGPGIQGNRMGLKEHELHVFTITSPSRANGHFLNYVEEFRNKLQFVDVLETGDDFHYTMPELLELAKGKYKSGQHREGIVIRPKTPVYSKYLNGLLSFKVINNDFLLKEK